MTILDQMYIGGDWTPSSTGGTMPVVDPATEKVISEAPLADADDIALALDSAERAWRDWYEAGAWNRSAILRRVASLIQERTDEFAETLTQEQGKPLLEARSEASAAADQFDWYADEARRIYGRLVDPKTANRRISVLKMPIGPVAAVTPWNFPLLLPARKVAPALAAGCSIILKPAEETPRSAFLLAKACHDAGLPAGVFNVVTGDPAFITSELINSDVIRKVTLTGSVQVGRHLLHLCADQIKLATMELGGSAPVLVCADADAAQSAEMCVAAKFRNAGQVCISPSRFYVHESKVDAFSERAVECAKALRVGPGNDPRSTFGPLTSARRREAVERLVEDAVQGGATVRTGGSRPAGVERGFFFEPTVLTDVRETMEVMTDEPFGPIAPIVPFSDLEDALKQANGSAYGLAGFAFTNDVHTAHWVSEQLEVGIVGINNLVPATAEAPFGGVKRSGFGREGGTEGIDAYLYAKYVSLGLDPR